MQKLSFLARWRLHLCSFTALQLYSFAHFSAPILLCCCRIGTVWKWQTPDIVTVCTKDACATNTWLPPAWFHSTNKLYRRDAHQITWQFVTPLMCVPLSQIVARYITSSLILHITQPELPRCDAHQILWQFVTPVTKGIAAAIRHLPILLP